MKASILLASVVLVSAGLIGVHSPSPVVAKIEIPTPVPTPWPDLTKINVGG